MIGYNGLGTQRRCPGGAAAAGGDDEDMTIGRVDGSGRDAGCGRASPSAAALTSAVPTCATLWPRRTQLLRADSQTHKVQCQQLRSVSSRFRTFRSQLRILQTRSSVKVLTSNKQDTAASDFFSHTKSQSYDLCHKSCVKMLSCSSGAMILLEEVHITNDNRSSVTIIEDPVGHIWDEPSTELDSSEKRKQFAMYGMNLPQSLIYLEKGSNIRISLPYLPERR